MLERYLNKKIRIVTNNQKIYYGEIKEIKDGFVLISFIRKEGEIIIKEKDISTLIELKE